MEEENPTQEIADISTEIKKGHYNKATENQNELLELKKQEQK